MKWNVAYFVFFLFSPKNFVTISVDPLRVIVLLFTFPDFNWKIMHENNLVWIVNERGREWRDEQAEVSAKINVSKKFFFSIFPPFFFSFFFFFCFFCPKFWGGWTGFCVQCRTFFLLLLFFLNQNGVVVFCSRWCFWQTEKAALKSTIK